jgi:DNA-binding response OmpR family regulator
VSFVRRVLVVEDDSGLRRLLVDVIAADADLEVDGAGGVGEAELRLAALGGQYDVILLDLGLPDGHGGEYCRVLRQRGVDCPIIMLTGCISRSATDYGPDYGASEYLAKPIGVAELMKCVRRQLNRAGTAPTGQPAVQ